MPLADITIEKGGTLITPPRVVINNTLIDNYGTWLGVRALSILNSGRLNVRSTASVAWNNSVLNGPQAANGLAFVDSLAMRSGTLWLDASVVGAIRNVSVTSSSSLILAASATMNCSMASFTGSGKLTLGTNALFSAVASSSYSATGLTSWNASAAGYIVPGTIEFATSGNALTSDNATIYASEALLLRSTAKINSGGTLFLASPKVINLESGSTIDGSSGGYTSGNGPGGRGESERLLVLCVLEQDGMSCSACFGCFVQSYCPLSISAFLCSL